MLAAVALAVCFGLIVLFLIDPARSTFARGPTLFPPCPLHAITGLYCPGCGTLRALHQLLHGNLWAAFRLNPLMVCSLPLVAYWCLSELMREVSGWRRPRLFLPAAWIWVLLGVIVLFGIVRNIPSYPFSLLAP
jgi:hypothetical protein